MRAALSGDRVFVKRGAESKLIAPFHNARAMSTSAVAEGLGLRRM